MIGKTLAHYEISELLGKGGMGEVYRARDTKLDRDVAIKVLPRETSTDPERIARFQREARTLATLQHTNVASIYGFEESEEHRFLVMELVEGEDLSERLARGSVPIDEAVAIARQIASGLEAAHDQGIVHRDLKPANVKLSPTGQVKILDFGLARAYQGDSGDVADPMNSPTLTAGMTMGGVVLGTAAYMSPEQARGKTVDRRADIWAFGVLVHEMISGRRLFAGETVSDTLAGVLKTKIDLADLPKDCPPALRRLLERCLDRDAATRLRDIGEARIVLEQPMDEATTDASAVAGNRGRRFAIGALAGIIVGAALVWFLAPTAEAPRPEREVRFSIPRENISTPRSDLAPDGTRLLYMNESRLWVREFRAMETREVPGTEGALMGNWSPDGEWIVFCTTTVIYKVRPDGNSRTRICEFENDMHSWAGSVDWTEDGRIVFATGDSGLMSVSSSGGDPKVLLAPGPEDTDFHQIHVLPGDRGFFFQPHIDMDFDSIHLFTGTERREVLRMPGQQINGAAYAAGHLVFRRTPDNVGIWAAPFSLETLEITGEPFLVVPDGNFPSVSRTGDLAYVPASRAHFQIVMMNERGRTTGVIGDPIQGAASMSVSPDGKRASLVVNDRNHEVRVVDLESGEHQRIVFSKDVIEEASWTRDGQGIAYSAGMSDAELHIELFDHGSGATRVLSIRGKKPELTRDGRFMVLSFWNEANEISIAYVDLEDPDLTPTMIADTPFVEDSPALSPDDRFVAYSTLESGTREIIVRSFPGGESQWQVSQQGGSEPFWSPSGDKIYFMSLSNDWLHVVDVSRDPVRFSPPRRLFEISNQRSFNALPDGGFTSLELSVGEGQGSYEIWLNWAASLEN